MKDVVPAPPPPPDVQLMVNVNGLLDPDPSPFVTVTVACVPEPGQADKVTMTEFGVQDTTLAVTLTLMATVNAPEPEAG